jgi:hypothetical protein
MKVSEYIQVDCVCPDCGKLNTDSHSAHYCDHCRKNINLTYLDEEAYIIVKRKNKNCMKPKNLMEMPNLYDTKELVDVSRLPKKERLKYISKTVKKCKTAKRVKSLKRT